TPLALLTIPILDTTAAILRRKLTGRSLYSTDRGHLHHCLQRRIANPRYVLLVVSGCCLVTVAGALGGFLMKDELMALVSCVGVVVMLVATRLFGHAELLLVTHRLRSFLKSFIRLPEPGGARQMEVRLQGTLEWSELWQQIIECGKQLNLCRM